MQIVAKLLFPESHAVIPVNPVNKRQGALWQFCHTFRHSNEAYNHAKLNGCPGLSCQGLQSQKNT